MSSSGALLSLLSLKKQKQTFFLGKSYEPQSSASSDNLCLDLGYSGYDKKTHPEII